MNRIRKVVHSSAKFVEDHRVAIAVTLTTALCVTLHMNVTADFNTFLREKNLYEEFYNFFEE